MHGQRMRFTVRPSMIVVGITAVVMATALLPAVAIGAVMVLGTAPVARAGEAQAADADPRTRRLIDEVVNTYKALPAYVDQGHVCEVTRYRGKQRTKASPVSLAYSRPNELAPCSASTELVCDGQNLSIAWVPLHRYVVIKAPGPIALSTFTDQMDEVTRTVALSGDQMHFPLVMALLSGDAQGGAMLASRGARLVVEPDRQVDGKVLHSLLVDQGMAVSHRLLIEPDTKLIRQIQELYSHSPERLADGQKRTHRGAGSSRNRGPPRASRPTPLKRTCSPTGLPRTATGSETSDTLFSSPRRCSPSRSSRSWANRPRISH